MIDSHRLLTLFEQLVSIDSPSFGERAMCDFLRKKLAELGIAADEDESAAKLHSACGNLYAYLDGEPALSPLLFCAHMDTVEPARGKRMQMDENGRITSMGDTVLGADDCAGLAAILEALTAIKESGVPHRPLEILFTVAEEPYCVGVSQFDFTRLRAKEGYVFDLTGPVGGAAFQAPTIISFTADFTGRSAHAGFAPEDGIHAIRAAAEAAARIPCGRVGKSTVNIGTITGGIANNIVPDHCRFTGEIRSFSDREAQEQLEGIRQAVEEAGTRYGAAVTVESVLHFKTYCTPLEHPVVKRFASACGQPGLQADLHPTFGGSDLNHLAQHGITGLVVANAMNNCHSCQEYTTLPELERAARLALALMLDKNG